MNYSYTRTVVKGLAHFIIVGGSFVLTALIMSGYADVSIWDLIEKYVKPIVGTVSIGAVVTMILNWIKNHD